MKRTNRIKRMLRIEHMRRMKRISRTEGIKGMESMKRMERMRGCFIEDFRIVFQVFAYARSNKNNNYLRNDNGAITYIHLLSLSHAHTHTYSALYTAIKIKM